MAPTYGLVAPQQIGGVTFKILESRFLMEAVIGRIGMAWQWAVVVACLTLQGCARSYCYTGTNNGITVDVFCTSSGLEATQEQGCKKGYMKLYVFFKPLKIVYGVRIAKQNSNVTVECPQRDPDW